MGTISSTPSAASTYPPLTAPSVVAFDQPVITTTITIADPFFGSAVTNDAPTITPAVDMSWIGAAPWVWGATAEPSTGVLVLALPTANPAVQPTTAPAAAPTAIPTSAPTAAPTTTPTAPTEVLELTTIPTNPTLYAMYEQPTAIPIPTTLTAVLQFNPTAAPTIFPSTIDRNAIFPTIIPTVDPTFSRPPVSTDGNAAFCIKTNGMALLPTTQSICSAYAEVQAEFNALIAGAYAPGNALARSDLFGQSVRVTFHDAVEVDQVPVHVF